MTTPLDWRGHDQGGEVFGIVALVKLWGYSGSSIGIATGAVNPHGAPTVTTIIGSL